MIHDFAELMTTPQVIEKEFKMKPEEFDKQFFAWLEAQTKVTVDGFDEWKKQLRGISEKAKAKNWDDVIKEGEAIRDIYPDYVEAGNVYDFLAQAYLAKGDKAKGDGGAGALFQDWRPKPGYAEAACVAGGEAGNKRAAAKALERLNVIYLEDEDAHKRLGNLYLELGNPTGAAREYGAVLAGGHGRSGRRALPVGPRAIKPRTGPTKRAMKCSRLWKPRPGSSPPRNCCWNCTVKGK